VRDIAVMLYWCRDLVRLVRERLLAAFVGARHGARNLCRCAVWCSRLVKMRDMVLVTCEGAQYYCNTALMLRLLKVRGMVLVTYVGTQYAARDFPPSPRLLFMVTSNATGEDC